MNFGIFYRIQRFTVRCSLFVNHLFNKTCRFQYPLFIEKPAIRSSRSVEQSLEEYGEKVCLSRDLSLRDFQPDMHRSKGNYIVDNSGNTILDLDPQNGSLPLGYNPNVLVDQLDSMDYDPYVANNISLHCYPPINLPELLGRSIIEMTPHKQLSEVTLTESVGLAIESAISLVFKEKGEGKIVAFKGATHGMTFGSLPLGTSSGIVKLDLPSPYTPLMCGYPSLKYPISVHQAENEVAEENSLEELEELLQSNPTVRAIIIEPLQLSTFHVPSPRFFKGIRAITHAHDVAIIVDESNTCLGLTGKMWALEWWNLGDETVDFVCFGKRALINGFYSLPKYRSPISHAPIDPWGGNPIKLLQLQRIYKELTWMKWTNETNIDNLSDTASVFLAKMKRLVQGRKITNIRGQGCMIAFDVIAGEKSDLIAYLNQSGIIVWGFGTNTIALRPAATLLPDDILHLARALYKYFE